MIRLSLAAAAVLGLMAQVPAPESAGTPDAKAAYDAGIAAVRAGDRAKAIPLFRNAVELDPRFVNAHDQFIDTTLTAAFQSLPASFASAHS